MSPTPDFVLEIREMIGDHPLWLPGVTAVITRGDGHVLLVERSDNGAWTPVTGIVDPGEEPAVAAAREALEETGVRIRVDRLASTSAHADIVHANGDRASYLDLTFACTWLEGDAHVADEESTDVRWWPLDALPPMAEVMLTRIEAATSGEREARFVGPPGQPAPIEVLTPDHPVLGVAPCEAGWVGVVLDTDLRASVYVAGTMAELVELVGETIQGAQLSEVRHDLPVDAEARRRALVSHGIVAPPWFRGAGFTEDDLLEACAAASAGVRDDAVALP